MKIAATILSYKNFNETTRLCLDSLLHQIKHKNIKLKVFDNSSPDDTPKLLIDYHSKNSGFELEINDKNIGFAAGFNKAFKNENADWILIIDSDTIFPNGSIATMCSILTNVEHNQQIISPITNNAGTCQYINFETSLPEQIITEAELLTKDSSENLIPIYRADFFCVAIKGELWKKLSGLSEDYGPGYYEDFDFCMRSRNLGFKSFLSEKWFVYHQGSASFKKNSNQKDIIKKNRKIFMNKFSNAEMRHRRDDVLDLINYYKKNSLDNNLIYKKRIQYVLKDIPRSILKRILWKIKTKKLILEI